MINVEGKSLYTLNLLVNQFQMVFDDDCLPLQENLNARHETNQKRQ